VNVKVHNELLYSMALRTLSHPQLWTTGTLSNCAHFSVKDIVLLLSDIRNAELMEFDSACDLFLLRNVPLLLVYINC